MHEFNSFFEIIFRDFHKSKYWNFLNRKSPYYVFSFSLIKIIDQTISHIFIQSYKNCASTSCNEAVHSLLYSRLRPKNTAIHIQTLKAKLQLITKIIHASDTYGHKKISQMWYFVKIFEVIFVLPEIKFTIELMNLWKIVHYW